MALHESYRHGHLQCGSEVLIVSSLKNLRSDGSFHGKLPSLPIPISLVAATTTSKVLGGSFFAMPLARIYEIVRFGGFTGFGRRSARKGESYLHSKRAPVVASDQKCRNYRSNRKGTSSKERSRIATKNITRAKLYIQTKPKEIDKGKAKPTPLSYCWIT
ncbi:hypothetical protein M5K25_003285 [Dendrobium thyrsiflorum]|uniref:Uncharacterized protein n=1 Tax=Dendrobium thyrsiflorum TaxID=117978 RepID=A0ABD0VIZ5_DENTH